MDDYASFSLKKNENGRLILFLTFKKGDFLTSDEKVSKEIISKYGKIINKYSNLYVVLDSRAVRTVSPELAWNLITDLIKCNDDAIKNVRKVAVLISSKEIRRLVDVMNKVYSFVVPTKFFEKNNDALSYIEN